MDVCRLTYWLLKRGPTDEKVWRREEVRGGAHRNNFCIIHGSGADVAVEEEVEGVAMDVEEEEEHAGDAMKVKVSSVLIKTKAPTKQVKEVKVPTKVKWNAEGEEVVPAPEPAAEEWGGIEEAEVEAEWGGIGGDESAVVEVADEEWGGIETAVAGEEAADEAWGGC